GRNACAPQRHRERRRRPARQCPLAVAAHALRLKIQERVLKIAIMGSGGIGGYYGAMLQNGGADVTFIARGAQLEALARSGIAVEGVKPVPPPTGKATDDPASIGPVDIVIFAVKLRDTETAARAILPVLKDGTAVISL